MEAKGDVKHKNVTEQVLRVMLARHQWVPPELPAVQAEEGPKGKKKRRRMAAHIAEWPTIQQEGQKKDEGLLTWLSDPTYSGD